MEIYRVDYNNYVVGMFLMRELDIPYADPKNDQFVRWRLRSLSTPVAYMTSIPATPFRPVAYTGHNGSGTLPENLSSEYDTARSFDPNKGTWYNNVGPLIAGSSRHGTQWHLRDPGPDNAFGDSDSGPAVDQLYPYDATNGTVSSGDRSRFKT